MAQVSVNITDADQTAIHTVYEAVCKDAEVSVQNQSDESAENQHVFIMSICSPKQIKHFYVVSKWYNQYQKGLVRIKQMV